MMVIMTILFIVASVIVIRWRRRFEAGNMTLWFVVMFFLYSVVGQMYRTELDSFSHITFETASEMICLAAFGVFLGVLFFAKKGNAHDIRNIERIPVFADPDIKRAKVVAWTVIIFGYLLWVMNYGRIGNINDIIDNFSNRVDRNAFLTENLGNYPYVHFLYVGYILYILICFVDARNTTKTLTRILFEPVFILSPLLIFYMLEGERSSLIKWGFSTLIACISFNKISTHIRTKHLIFFVLCFFLFSVIGNLRSGLQCYIATGDRQYLSEKLWDPRALMYSKEFSAVNFTLNKTIDDIQRGEDLGYGYSYYQSVPYLFPRRVYRFLGLQKRPTIADKFGTNVALEIDRTRKMGFGFSPVAEAVHNFWYYGVTLVFIVITAYLEKLNDFIRHASIRVRYFGILLSPTVFMINRSAFANIFSVIVWVSAISIVIFFLCRKRLSLLWNTSVDTGHFKQYT